MQQLFELLSAIKYPCQVYDTAGVCVFQNDVFSLHFSGNPGKNSQSIYQLISNHAHFPISETLSSHSGKYISVNILVSEMSCYPGLKIVMLQNQEDEWNNLSLEKIESSRFVALGQMASDISHEINNPLTVVLSKLYFLEQQLSRPETHMTSKERSLDAIHKAQSNVTRITKIIKGLKNLARDSRSDGFEKKDLNEVIDDALTMCEERLKAQGIILKRSLSPTPLICQIQPIQICQVIINLFNNAIDAIAEVNLGQIDILSFEEKNQIVFRIQDSGPGVPEGIRKLIMNPFYTTKPAGVGTGLGLSISRQIMQSHQGSLILNAEVSPSCFEIHLPKLEVLNEA